MGILPARSSFPRGVNPEGRGTACRAPTERRHPSVGGNPTTAGQACSGTRVGIQTPVGQVFQPAGNAVIPESESGMTAFALGNRTKKGHLS